MVIKNNWRLLYKQLRNIKKIIVILELKAWIIIYPSGTFRYLSVQLSDGLMKYITNG